DVSDQVHSLTGRTQYRCNETTGRPLAFRAGHADNWRRTVGEKFVRSGPYFIPIRKLLRVYAGAAKYQIEFRQSFKSPLPKNRRHPLREHDVIALVGNHHI